MPSKILGGKSPVEVLCPNTPFFQVPPKVLGCTCFVHIPKHQGDKLDPKAVKWMFVGYPSSQKGYKCYTPGNKERLFEINGQGLLKYFPGLEVARSIAWIVISQRKYTLDLLAETGKLGAKPAETPIELSHGLHIWSGELLQDKRIYQRLVGRLIYLTITRTDISYVVSQVSQFMHAPRTDHLAAVHRILRYLKGSPSQGILYKSHGHAKAMAYNDADWVIIER